jgi:hypothetical protein
MAVSADELAERMIQFQLISGLLNVVANLNHPESQKYAASTLLVSYFCVYIRINTMLTY